MSRRPCGASGGRPKLLLVTYEFPPSKAIGCVRTWNIAKHLTRLGWAVTVLTLDPALWRNVESPEATTMALDREGIRRLLADQRWRWVAVGRVKCSDDALTQFVGGICRRVLERLGMDRTVGWLKSAERACSHLTAQDVDVILASGPPFSAFSLAQRLSERLGCPYVLDYRDLWSRDLHQPAPTAVRREASVLARSAAVITVSPTWGAVLEQHFGVGPKLHVISNGYDSEELASVKPHDFGHFAIVYTGSLWPPKRVISPLMAALRRLNEDPKSSRREWKFHYYGRHGSHVSTEAERFGVTRSVIVHGDVPRPSALAAVKGAAVSVVITSVTETGTPEDNGMVTGKIFEAIGLGTPILLIAPAGSDANDVARVAGRARSFAADDVEGISSFLDNLMKAHFPEPKDPAAYAWENLVSGFDRILRKAIAA